MFLFTFVSSRIFALRRFLGIVGYCTIPVLLIAAILVVSRYEFTVPTPLDIRGIVMGIIGGISTGICFGIMLTDTYSITPGSVSILSFGYLWYLTGIFGLPPGPDISFNIVMITVYYVWPAITLTDIVMTVMKWKQYKAFMVNQYQL